MEKDVKVITDMDLVKFYLFLFSRTILRMCNIVRGKKWAISHSMLIVSKGWSNHRPTMFHTATVGPKRWDPGSLSCTSLKPRYMKYVIMKYIHGMFLMEGNAQWHCGPYSYYAFDEVNLINESPAIIILKSYWRLKFISSTYGCLDTLVSGASFQNE